MMMMKIITIILLRFAWQIGFHVLKTILLFYKMYINLDFLMRVPSAMAMARHKSHTVPISFLRGSYFAE